MSFAAVRFFSVNGMSRTTSTVPVFNTAAKEASAAAGTDAAFVPSFQWSDVKVRRDTGDQVLQLPVDQTQIAAFERCNLAVVCYSEYNRWYWITGYTEITNSAYPNGTANRLMYEVTLEYIPVTTSVSLTGSNLNILPERMPTATPRMMQNWTEGLMMKTSPGTAFPALPKCPKCKRFVSYGVTQDVPTLWCEVTYTTTSGIRKYGLFLSTMSVSPEGDTLSYANAIATSTWSILGRKDVFPSLQEIMNDPETYLGITSGTITDINISEFCPYETVTAVTNTAPNEYVNLKSKSGAALAPTEVAEVLMHYFAYELPIISNIYENPSYDYKYPKPCEGTLSLTLTTFEGMNGTLKVRDSMRNDVYTFPREIMDNTVTISYMCYSDTSNIYMVLSLGQFQITLPGYKIPWTTTMWDQYRAYNLQFDRQALQNNIDVAEKEMYNSLIDGAANGIIGGAMTGAITGGALGAGLGAATGTSSFFSSAVSANIRKETTINKLKRDQDLTEQRMKGGPPTMNNTSFGYGVMYMITKYGGAEIILEMPANFTETQWDKQTAAWGYPSNKVLVSGTLSEGYWKGRVLSFTSGSLNNTSAGEAFERLIEQIDGGIRIVKVV